MAAELNVNSRHLSQVINELLDQNFYDLINKYRVEEVKKYIKKNPGKNISEMMYEAGFNSKAAFNNAFKKHTGMTPTEYRRLN